MTPNIHILGIQGSGKGTQSALLVAQFHFLYLSSGNLFRERAAQGDAFGKQIAHQLQVGRLLPDGFLIDTVQEHLSQHPTTNGLLGDGVIRTIDQYHKLEPVWKEHGYDEPLLIHLLLDEETALKRIEGRKAEEDNEAKKEHHRIYSGKLLHRTDENPLAIQKRFALFHSMTEPVIAAFESLNRSINVDASRTVEEIHRDIASALIIHYPQLGHGAD
jgi:adenylate kinase